MPTEKNSLSFGRYVKAIRIEKGISLEQVSRETKIGMDALLLIEKEDHQGLPAEVFVKGFLRAYARAVGADADSAVRRYLSSRRALQETAGFDIDSTDSDTNIWPRFLFSLAALSCIVALSIFGVSFYQERHSDNVATTDRAVNERRDTIDSGPVQAVTVERRQNGNRSAKLLLRIITVEDTHIKVTIDDRKPETHNLHTGDRLELAASTGFKLLISNAGGVRLMLNKKSLTVPGKSGEAVSLQLP